MSSNGPPRNYRGVLEVNLQTCAKGTKWRVYILSLFFFLLFCFISHLLSFKLSKFFLFFPSKDFLILLKILHLEGLDVPSKITTCLFFLMQFKSFFISPSPSLFLFSSSLASKVSLLSKSFFKKINK